MQCLVPRSIVALRASWRGIDRNHCIPKWILLLPSGPLVSFIALYATQSGNYILLILGDSRKYTEARSRATRPFASYGSNAHGIGRRSTLCTYGPSLPPDRPSLIKASGPHRVGRAMVKGSEHSFLGSMKALSGKMRGEGVGGRPTGMKIVKRNNSPHALALVASGLASPARAGGLATQVSTPYPRPRGPL